MIPFVCG